LEGRQEGFEGEGLEFFGRIGRFGDGVFKNWNGRVGEGFHAIALIPQKIIPETIIWKAWNFMIATKTKVWHNSLKSGSGGIGIVEGLFTFAAQRNLLFINKNFRTMRKIITMVVAFGLMGLSANCQNCVWAKDAGGKLEDLGNSIAADINGNVYVIGNFMSDSMFFGSIAIYNQNPSGSRNNIFLVKYDPNGTLLWAKSFGCSLGSNGNSVCTDHDGNVLITGIFNGDSITFGNYTLYSNAIYIVKLDPSGNVLWAKNPSGGGGITYSITTDLNNNILITGDLESSIITFDSVSISVIWGTANLFLFKFDSNGNALWGQNANGSYSAYGNSMATDNNRNIYLTGYFTSDTSYFDTIMVFNNNLNNYNGDYEDMFIAKYDSSGHIQWVKTAGGEDESWGCSVSCDQNGFIYITGSFTSGPLNNGVDIILDTITLYDYSYSSVMQTILSNLFIAKYDNNGNVQWAKAGSYDGTLGSDGTSVSTDLFGNVFATGYYYDSLIIDSTALYDSGGNYLIKFASDGSILWAQTVPNWQYSNSVCTDQNGNAFITGYFGADSMTFGTHTIHNDSMPAMDVFVAKYVNNQITTYIPTSIINTYVSLYPNPTTSLLTLSLPNTNQKAIINLYDMMGQLIIDNGQLKAIDNGQLTIDNKASSMSIVNYQLSIEKLPQGIYFLEVLMDGEKVVKKVIKL
jgi:hypothetical protein